MKDSFQALLTTSQKFATGMLCNNLSKQDARTAYFTVFVPSVTYSLPVAHLSKENMQMIQSPATRSCLVKT
jgi:hypothetical protein